MADQIRTRYGFIANAPRIVFKRCDGRVFVSDTGTASNINRTDTSNAVYGGWGRAPLGFIPGDSGMEISFTDAMFYEDMYSTLSAGTPVTQDTSVWENGVYEIQTISGSPVYTYASLPFEINPENVIIDGLTQVALEDPDSPPEIQTGEFYAYSDSSTHKSVVTFYPDDFNKGDMVSITYQRRIANGYVKDITSEMPLARGSLYLSYPVMTAGTDCTQSAKKAYYHVVVPRVMVSQYPTLDTSRGSAATPQATFMAIDSKRADGLWYRTIYEPLDGGNIATDYDGNIDYSDF